MNILIPMAGAGKRFQEAGYHIPKPFIQVNGKPMIARVIENLTSDQILQKFILIALRSHLPFLKEINGLLNQYNNLIVVLDNITDGAVCTCLKVKSIINDNTPLIIANCDQIEEWNINDFLSSLHLQSSDGCILTYNAYETGNTIKNSYVRLNDHGNVIETKEKECISNLATCGIYYWHAGRFFINSAEEMISSNDSYKREYYVCPTYNYLIKKGYVIKTYHIDKHYSLGTPEDLEVYINATSPSSS